MHYRFQPEWLCVTTVTSRGTLSEQQQRNIRGNIVSGLVRKRRVRETSYPKFWCLRHETLTASCNWPEHRCHLRNIRNIRESIVSGLVAKEGCAKLLTRNIRFPCPKLLQRLAIGQNRNVTCGTFAEAASADRPRVTSYPEDLAVSSIYV